MRRSDSLLAVLFVLAFAVLCGLGYWQVQRLIWKEALIARVEARLAAPASPLGQALSQAGSEPGGIDYRPAKISGRFLDAEPMFEFTTHSGQTGWNLFAPFELAQENTGSEARFAFVNRGFLPYELRDNWRQVAPLPGGPVETTGLLRESPDAKPGMFMPDNDPEKRIFFWRDVAGMARLAGIDDVDLARWYLDAGLPGQAVERGKFPIPGTTLVRFSNNHLQYAITWFGLALGLLLVGGFFFRSRMRKTAGA